MSLSEIKQAAREAAYERRAAAHGRPCRQACRRTQDSDARLRACRARSAGQFTGGRTMTTPLFELRSDPSK